MRSVEHERRTVGHSALAPRLRVPGHDVVQPLLETAIEGASRSAHPLSPHPRRSRPRRRPSPPSRARAGAGYWAAETAPAAAVRLRQALRVRVDHPRRARSSAGRSSARGGRPVLPGAPAPDRRQQHRERAHPPREGVVFLVEPSRRRRLESYDVAAERASR